MKPKESIVQNETTGASSRNVSTSRRADLLQDSMLLDDAENPRYLWVGYSEIGCHDRFIIRDRKAGFQYIYVSLETACRFLTDPTDARNVVLVFRADPEHDARLEKRREDYQKETKRSLEYWDHEPLKKPIL